MVLFSFLCLRFFLICIYRFIQGYMINQRTHYYYVGVKSYKIIRPLYEKRISILILLLIMLVSAAISFINKWWQKVSRIEIDVKKFNYGQLKTRSF
jgi:hypothetical protein